MAKLKRHISKPTNKYVWSLEHGYAPRNIPARPLVQPTLAEYTPLFLLKIEKVKAAIKGVWK